MCYISLFSARNKNIHSIISLINVKLFYEDLRYRAGVVGIPISYRRILHSRF